MKKTLGFMLLAGLPFISNAQKDSLAKLRNDVQLLQSQNQQLVSRIIKLEDRIPYYENALKLQQAPTVQTLDSFEVRLTKVYFIEKDHKLFVEGIVTAKKQNVHDMYFDGTMFKCVYPDGKLFQTYTVLNNGKGFSTISPVVSDVPYSFQIVFENAEKTPKLAALQLRIDYTPERPMLLKRLDFAFKGLTVD
ncbi:MAG: hypothetical protein DI598_15435 [Pseudopedobacter saltans]|uniref:Uncharacterized protein n=1 Tax=Pseudopedobacter saltans TaxID=151895 RepID=A0A2W5EKH5_9SPHI|nr:MAG: hypothetical protein DI598_15435 [Pseudopedobacter saltans]